MSVLAAKRKEFQAKTAEAVALRDKIAASAEGTDTKSDQDAFDKLMDETIPALETEIKRLAKLEDAESKAKEGSEDEEGEAPQRKTRDSPARVEERAQEATTVGDAILHSESFQKALKRAKAGEAGISVALEIKGGTFARPHEFGIQTKADGTFNTTATGLDTTTIYLPRSPELYSQQRLKVRDILPAGQTSQSTVKWIKEESFTNDADMVAEEGQKPYSELDLGVGSADVKKVAILQKLSDEMMDDFPFLRSYVNTRTIFKLMAKEEQQLLNGTGAGNQIRGILNFSGIQSKAKAAATPAATALNAIHNAITLVREVMSAGSGGYEPSAIVMHPTDYENIRLTLDGNNQYYGGGPFDQGPYGSGEYKTLARPWGLPVVITTAIAAGTALVGDFINGAMLVQRTGVRVELFNQNVDDVEFNRLTLRVEERLALADFADSAFCKVTGL